MNISNSTAQALSTPGPASTLPAVQLLNVRAVTQSSESPSATFTLPSPSSITVDGGRVLRQLASSHAQPSASSNAFGASVGSTRRGEGGGRRRLLNIRARRDAGSTSASAPTSAAAPESSTSAANSTNTESSTSAEGLRNSTSTESSTTAEGSTSTVTSTSSAGSTSAPSSTSTSSPVNVVEILAGVLGSLVLALGLGFVARSLMGCIKRNRDPRQVAMGGLSSVAQQNVLLLIEAMRDSMENDGVLLEELIVFLLNRQDNGENASRLLIALLEKGERETEV